MIIVKTLFDRLIVGSWPLSNNCDWLCEKGPHAIITVFFDKMCKNGCYVFIGEKMINVLLETLIFWLLFDASDSHVQTWF